MLLDDDTLDLLIADGDLVVDESDGQHAELIIHTHKGEWKQWPETGVGALDYIQGPGTEKEKLIQAIKNQLRADGYRVRKLDDVAFQDDGLTFSLEFELI